MFRAARGRGPSVVEARTARRSLPLTGLHPGATAALARAAAGTVLRELDGAGGPDPSALAEAAELLGARTVAAALRRGEASDLMLFEVRCLAETMLDQTQPGVTALIPAPRSPLTGARGLVR